MSARLFNAGVDSAEQLKSGWLVFPSRRRAGPVELQPDARTSRQRADCSLAPQTASACVQLNQGCLLLHGGCYFVDVGLPLGAFGGGKQVRVE